MAREPLDRMNCSIAHALDVVGSIDGFLILRNAFNGMRTFDAFQDHLGLSSSVLSTRLKQMTEAGILRKTPSPTDGRSYEYRLTEQGLGLYPVMVALLHWGERWTPDPGGERMFLTETATGRPVAQMAVRSEDGRPLRPQEITAVAGPGADNKIRQLVGWRHRQG